MKTPTHPWARLLALICSLLLCVPAARSATVSAATTGELQSPTNFFGGSTNRLVPALLPFFQLYSANLDQWALDGTNRLSGYALLTALDTAAFAPTNRFVAQNGPATNIHFYESIRQNVYTNTETVGTTNIYFSLTNSVTRIDITNTAPILLQATNYTLPAGYSGVVHLYSGITNRHIYLDTAFAGWDTNSNPFLMPSNSWWVVNWMNGGPTRQEVGISVNPQTR